MSFCHVSVKSLTHKNDYLDKDCKVNQNQKCIPDYYKDFIIIICDQVLIIVPHCILISSCAQYILKGVEINL